MLLTELEDASQGKLVLWGVLLLLINLCTVCLAIWLQITEYNRQAVLQLVRVSHTVSRSSISHDLVSKTHRCFSNAKFAKPRCW